MVLFVDGAKIVSLSTGIAYNRRHILDIGHCIPGGKSVVGVTFLHCHYPKR